MGYCGNNSPALLDVGTNSLEMETEFKKLYDSLITYKDNIFHLVDTLCNDFDVSERLAMNIAERDTMLLQRLVAKECYQRNMSRKTGDEPIIEAVGFHPVFNDSIQQLLQKKAASPDTREKE